MRLSPQDVGKAGPNQAESITNYPSFGTTTTDLQFLELCFFSSKSIEVLDNLFIMSALRILVPVKRVIDYAVRLKIPNLTPKVARGQLRDCVHNKKDHGLLCNIKEQLIANIMFYRLSHASTRPKPPSRPPASSTP